MCDSKGVWSPVCDDDWTLEDATVVCRELGHQDPAVVAFDTLQRESYSELAVECSGSESSLASCPTLAAPETTCQYLLIHCKDHKETEDEEDEFEDETTPVENSTSSGVDSNATTSTNGSSVNDVETGDIDEGGDKDNGASGDNNDNGTGDDNGGGGDREVPAGGNNSSDPTADDTHESTSSPPDVTSREKEKDLSVGVFSAITGAVVVTLILTTLTTLLLVYMRRRRKQKTTSQVEDVAGPHQSEGASGVGEKHLDNPTYTGSLEASNCPQTADAPEHHVVNPLYDLTVESTETQLYAVLECPNYAIPGEVHVPASPTDNGLTETDSLHNYDYADIPISGEKVDG
jgi:hypothetical protein